jgi:hypothetical protein
MQNRLDLFDLLGWLMHHPRTWLSIFAKAVRADHEISSVEHNRLEYFVFLEHSLIGY